MKLERELSAKLIDEIEAVEGRVYPIIAPEAGGGKAPPTPLIVYNISRTRDYTLEGSGDAVTSVQIDIYGKTYPVVQEVSQALMASMAEWDFPKALYHEDEMHWSDTTVSPALFRITHTFEFHHADEA
jgi:hypothetical protein